MKKLLALLLAMSMLLALAACGDDEDTNDDNTPASSSASESSAPEADDHTHSYTSAVTADPTCAVDGVETFTCSCGDSYTEAIAASGHTWGDWELEANALVRKPGSEKRTCSVCSETETQERTANAIANSFYDGGLIRILLNNYGTVSASSLLEYASREFHEYADKPVAAATIYAALAQRFDISNYFDEPLSDFMKERFGYDAASDTYTLHDYGDTATVAVLGYVHQGGNRYDVYYGFTPDGIDVTLNYKIELEYYRTDGAPNKYLSIARADELPSDMIACADGEQSELNS